MAGFNENRSFPFRTRDSPVTARGLNIAAETMLTTLTAGALRIGAADPQRLPTEHRHG